LAMQADVVTRPTRKGQLAQHLTQALQSSEMSWL